MPAPTHSSYRGITEHLGGKNEDDVPANLLYVMSVINIKKLLLSVVAA